MTEVMDPELAEAELALEGAWQAARSMQSGHPLRFKVQFTASQEYVDLLEEAIDLLGFTKKTTSYRRSSYAQLRCGSHNSLAAEADFGREHIDFMRGGERTEALRE